MKSQKGLKSKGKTCIVVGSRLLILHKGKTTQIFVLGFHNIVARKCDLKKKKKDENALLSGAQLNSTTDSSNLLNP